MTPPSAHPGPDRLGPVSRSLRRLVRLFAPRRPKTRTVLLVDFDNEIKVASAKRCNAGWIARWHKSDNKWLVLNPDGTITGQRIRKWLPHSGWDDQTNDQDQR